MMQTLTLITLYVAAIILFCGVASRLPVLAPESQHRVSSLDGLRGILATAVVVYHLTVSYYWHTTSLWQMTDSRVINNFGAVPVSLFFMITGYLFGSKVSRGVPAWRAIFVSRVRRIFPMYLVSVALVAAIAFLQPGDQPASFMGNVRALGHWLVFLAAPINGVQGSWVINAGVQWTLQYEAMFYVALPLLYCLLQRRLALVAVAVSVLGLAALWAMYATQFDARYLKLFVAGIAVALLEHRLRCAPVDYTKWPFTLVALLALMLCMSLEPYSAAQMILLAGPFCMFVLGNSLGGLLEHRGLKVLGEASFSIYLLHGILIYTLFNVLAVHDFQAGTFFSFAWYLPLVLWGAAILGVATYWGVERPFMRQGSHKVVRPAQV